MEARSSSTSPSASAPCSAQRTSSPAAWRTTSSVAPTTPEVEVEARSALPEALACPSSSGSLFKENVDSEVHTVTATNNVQWSARLAVVPAVREEEVEEADTDVVKLVVTFATTVTARCHQGRAEDEAVQQSTAAGTAASALDLGESALPPPQALPVEAERLTDVPDPPKPVLLFKNKQHHVDDYKEVVSQLMVDVVSMVTAEFLPKALPRLPAPLSVAGHLGQGLSELETTGESWHRCSLDIDAPMPMATMLGNYKPNYSGEEHRGRVFYEPREVFWATTSTSSSIFLGEAGLERFPCQTFRFWIWSMQVVSLKTLQQLCQAQFLLNAN